MPRGPAARAATEPSGIAVIEALASIAVVWRCSGALSVSQAAERRVRQAVTVSFFLLAPRIAYEAITKLAAASTPNQLAAINVSR